MSYKADAQAGNDSADNAIEITGDLTDLTFFPNSKSDFFKHIGAVGDVLSISTSNPKNGVLTGLNFTNKPGVH